MRLGALEKAIVLACLDRRTSADRWQQDIKRKQLPDILWGWHYRDGRYVTTAILSQASIYAKRFRFST